MFFPRFFVAELLGGPDKKQTRNDVFVHQKELNLPDISVRKRRKWDKDAV